MLEDCSFIPDGKSTSMTSSLRRFRALLGDVCEVESEPSPTPSPSNEPDDFSEWPPAFRSPQRESPELEASDCVWKALGQRASGCEIEILMFDMESCVEEHSAQKCCDEQQLAKQSACSSEYALGACYDFSENHEASSYPLLLQRMVQNAELVDELCGFKTVERARRRQEGSIADTEPAEHDVHALTSTMSPSPSPSRAPSSESTSTPSPTPPASTPTLAPPGGDPSDSVCFPASATVELESGRVVRMDELRHGDAVRAKPGNDRDAFSKVYFFGHKQEHRYAQYVVIGLSDGSYLSASPQHLVFSSGAGRMVRASAMRVGDWVQTSSGVSEQVSTIEWRLERGAYNPHNLHGELYVNSVRASCYTAIVPPSIAHLLLVPFRLLFHAIGYTRVDSFFHGDAPAVLLSTLKAYVPS